MVDDLMHDVHLIRPFLSTYSLHPSPSDFSSRHISTYPFTDFTVTNNQQKQTITEPCAYGRT